MISSGHSFLILFLELSCIRWFGSTVIFLTFFTNIILMACFLGMSVGLLSAEGRFDRKPRFSVSLVSGFPNLSHAAFPNGLDENIIARALVRGEHKFTNALFLSLPIV